MKKIILTSVIICTLFTINVNAQTKLINPIQAIVGNDEKTYPQGYMKDNAALIIWHDGSSDVWDKPAPLFQISTHKASITFGVATTTGMGGALAESDIFMQSSGEAKRVNFESLLPTLQNILHLISPPSPLFVVHHRRLSA